MYCMYTHISLQLFSNIEYPVGFLAMVGYLVLKREDEESRVGLLATISRLARATNHNPRILSRQNMIAARIRFQSGKVYYM